MIPTLPADVAAFDPFDPGLRADPYPTYRRVREHAPVLRRPDGFWVLTGHREVTEVLANPAWGHSVLTVPRPGPGEVRSFLVMNPPDHTRLRGLVSKAFTARVVAALEQRITGIVEETLDALLASAPATAPASVPASAPATAPAADSLGGPGTVDLIASFAYPLPVTVICELLGVPLADRARFHTWSTHLARGLDPDVLLDAETIERRLAARREFAAYFTELADARRDDPRDDLLSRLVAISDDGDTLSRPELLSTCILLLVAGHETTVNLIANGTLALLRNPAELDRFRADPDLAGPVVEEVLRYDPPVSTTARVALRDTDVAGRPAPAGAVALLLLAAASRDPALVADPDRFDLTRPPSRHLSFGHGIHFCLGAPLARLEARIALRALVTRVPGLALADPDTPLTYRDNLILRGLEALPVRVR